MAASPLDTVPRAFGGEYHSFEKLSDLLRSLLRLTIQATCAERCSILLTRPSTTDGPSTGRELFVGLEARTDGMTDKDFLRPLTLPPRLDSVPRAFREICTSCPPNDGPRIEIPIRYQDRRIGTLVLERLGVCVSEASSIESLEVVAQIIAHQAKRYELQSRIMAAYGRDHTLVGASPALRKLDDFIEKASRADLPVIVCGELGTPVDCIPYMIHCAVRLEKRRLVEIKCAALNPSGFREVIERACSDSRVGALFLNGIDELNLDLQYMLLEFLDSGLGVPVANLNEGTRIYVSASVDLERLVAEGRFCRPLLWKLNYLTASVPPLRNRKEDIRPSIEYFLRKYAPGRPARMDNEALDLCVGHKWPGNEGELERVVARLAALSGSDRITLANICAYAPQILDVGLNRPVVSLMDEVGTRKMPKNRGHYDPAPSNPLSDLARDLLHEKAGLARLSTFHPGLRRALIFLSSSFSEDIPFRKLAREAALSASHLSHLFQTYLGASFKEVLSAIRIEMAKEELVRDPHATITELAGSVGFAELRSFERAFKRLVGCTPSQFRQIRD